MLDEVNPYTVGNPIDESEMFFGRNDVFDDIRNKLIGRHRNNVIVLCGQRRIGKTSVLYQMRSRLGPGYLCILIDFHALMLDDLSSFLLSLANAITDNLQIHYNITIASPISGTFSEDPGHSFANVFLKRLWAAVDNRHVLLMLDEATRLQEQHVDPKILTYLRYLIQHHANLDFLFSFSSLEEMKKEHTFLLNICLYKKISFLDQDSAYKLVTAPVKNFYTIEPQALERFFQLTSGHPYYIQLLCMNIFLNWQAQFRHGLQGSEMFINQEEVAAPQLSHIETRDVEAAISQSLEAGELVLRDTWNESTDGEKAIISTIATLMDEGNRSIEDTTIDQFWSARFAITIPERDKVKSMQLLADRDIISRTSPYIFKVELFYLWVQKYKALATIKVDEIADTLIEWHLLTEPTLPLQEEESSELSAPPSSTPLSFGERLRFFLEPARSLVSWAQSGQPQSGIWSSTDVQAPGLYPISRRRFAWAGLVGLGLAAVGGIAWWKFSLPSPSQSSSHAVGDTLLVYPDHHDSVYTVAWSPKGEYIASGGGDGVVRIWDAFSGKSISTLDDSNSQNTIYAVAWARDNNRIAVGDGSGMIKIWSPIPKKVLSSCVGHSKEVYTLAWSPDNQDLVSGSADKTMRIWDAASGKQVPRYALFSKDHSDVVYWVAWSNDGNYIASVGADKTIEIFNFTENSRVLAYQDGSNDVYAVAWSPDDQYIVTGGQDGGVKIWKWSPSSSTTIKIWKEHKGSVTAVAWSPNGKYIASASADMTVKVWDVATAKSLFTYTHHRDAVNDITWSPDSKYIVSAGGIHDGTVRVWKAP